MTQKVFVGLETVGEAVDRYYRACDLVKTVIPRPALPSRYPWMKNPELAGAELECHEMGMSTVEASWLHNRALEQMAENPMLRKAYRDFLMIAKLTLSDDLANERRASLARQHAWLETNTKYQNALKAHATADAARIRKVDEMLETVERRFNRIIKSLEKLINISPKMEDCDEQDERVLFVLNKMTEFVFIDSEWEVTRFEVEGLLGLSREKKIAILLKMAERLEKFKF